MDGVMLTGDVIIDDSFESLSTLEHTLTDFRLDRMAILLKKCEDLEVENVDLKTQCITNYAPHRDLILPELEESPFDQDLDSA
jgi:hypothetical protein